MVSAYWFCCVDVSVVCRERLMRFAGRDRDINQQARPQNADTHVRTALKDFLNVGLSKGGWESVSSAFCHPGPSTSCILVIHMSWNHPVRPRDTVSTVDDSGAAPRHATPR